jgi:hypothetical protein
VGTKIEFAGEAKARLKGELARANVKYADLARRMTAMGVPETEGSLQVKISRGRFSAWFMIAALRAIGTHTLEID